ncbi:MAG TPA: RluA family pseudouridine synthase [Polyangiaceae bacterium]|nr:RluA family pseudouridine synthase [Polyangiaceae bacterium]
MSSPNQCWVVERAESLEQWLERQHSKPAFEEGRVFVDGRRALDLTIIITPGSKLEIYAPRSGTPTARVLHRSGGWLFAEKPPGISTEPDKRGHSACVVSQLAHELGIPARNIHALSRLDLGVSGVVLLALDEASRKRALAWRAAGQIRRRYVALGAGHPKPEQGEWNDAIARGPADPRRQVTDSGKASQSRYRVACCLTEGSPVCLLALEPVTGRTHQLRVHASAHGAPLLGDPSYGGPRRWVFENGQVIALPRVLLHASWAKLPGLPRVMAPIPADFSRIWQQLGGSEEDLERAVEVTVSTC